MLDAPEVARAIQAVGATLRFEGALSPALREVAILATAAAFGSGYEWDYHLAIASEAGVAAPVIAMAASGEASPEVDPASHAVIAVCREAVLARGVGQDRLAQLVDATSRAGASEVVAIAGYYQLLGLFLSAGALDYAVSG